LSRCTSCHVDRRRLAAGREETLRVLLFIILAVFAVAIIVMSFVPRLSQFRNSRLTPAQIEQRAALRMEYVTAVALRLGLSAASAGSSDGLVRGRHVTIGLVPHTCRIEIEMKRSPLPEGLQLICRSSWDYHRHEDGWGDTGDAAFDAFYAGTPTPLLRALPANVRQALLDLRVVRADLTSTRAVASLDIVDASPAEIERGVALVDQTLALVAALEAIADSPPLR
jgi:hypothetical protein